MPRRSTYSTMVLRLVSSKCCQAADRISRSGWRCCSGMSLSRTLSDAAWRDSARFTCGSTRANFKMPEGIPMVETDRERCPMLMPCGEGQDLDGGEEGLEVEEGLPHAHVDDVREAGAPSSATTRAAWSSIEVDLGRRQIAPEPPGPCGTEGTPHGASGLTRDACRDALLVWHDDRFYKWRCRGSCISSLTVPSVEVLLAATLRVLSPICSRSALRAAGIAVASVNQANRAASGVRAPGAA